MMTRIFAALFALLLSLQVAVAQQEAFFIQVEARTSLNGAQSSVREYSAEFPNVNGFALGGGWYGVALGPFASRAEADRELRVLRRARQVPSDAYVETSRKYGRQFFPIGGARSVTEPESAPVAEPAPQPTPTPAPQPTQTETAQAPTTQPAPEPEPEREETQREALASERLLSRAEREELQIALRWAGFYKSSIDGAFGRGTRNSMGAWQKENGFDVTGVLTTRQRAELLRQYYAPLEGMGMALYTDPRLGIEVELPLGAVTFDRYESPFALFKPVEGGPGARVLLISQPGDAKTMGGLYEIMQTLEIVPLEGERKRNRSGFLLTGANDKIVSHTEVRLERNTIKGVTVIWPAGDEERRGRVLERIKASFKTIPGVLDPATVTDAGQQVDLVSGLKVRKPKVTASGFFADATGTTVTAASLVEGCERVTLNEIYEAEVRAVDEALGVAVLRPTTRIAPGQYAAFSPALPRLQSELAVGGFSFGGVLGAPSLTYGTLADTQGLQGEAAQQRLAMQVLPGDAGGPVFDAGGGVVGMLLPRESEGTRRLPETVNFAVKASDLVPVLTQAGVTTRPHAFGGAVAPEDLTKLARGMTVLVSCW